MFHLNLNTLPPIQHKLAKIPRDFPGRFPAFSKAAPSAPEHSGQPLPCALPGQTQCQCGGARDRCLPALLSAPALLACAPPLPAAAGGMPAVADRCGRGALQLGKAMALRAPSCSGSSSPAASSQPAVSAMEAAALGRDGRRERLRETLSDGMRLTLGAVGS